MSTIPHDALVVLSAGRCDGHEFFLPPEPLERNLYESVNKVLTALGGKWNRRAKAHVFADACAELIDAAIETGEYSRPQDMGWFPTPPDVARRVVALANIGPGHRALEPSAGLGSLADIARAGGAHVDCVEIDPARARALSDAGHAVTEGDFLAQPPRAEYDCVVMNPPFARRADIHHVNHARGFLRPSGRLVSIMSAGVAFREDVLTREFRRQCETITALPDGSFRPSGTDVRTVVVTMGAA